MDDSNVTCDVNDSEIICPICNAEFLDTEDLKTHKEQHSHLSERNNNKVCNICFSKFPDMELYALHIINTHLTTAVGCKYCLRVFFDRDRAKQHEIKHKALKLAPFISCSQCKKYFNNYDELEHHEYTKHPDKEGIMLQNCFPMLSSLLNMNIRHFLKVTPDQYLYKCIQCKMSTPDMEKYLKHLETEQVKSLTCNRCTEVFFLKQSIAKHMRKKSNRNCCNYLIMETCEKCGQKFDPILLKDHKKYCKEITSPKYRVRCLSTKLPPDSIIRNGDISLPLVQCKFCQKPFTSTALAKHIQRIHMSNLHRYKYRCTYCDVVFKHPKYLFGHYGSQHKDLEPYTCKICNEKFRIRKNFTVHIKLKHNSIGFVEFAENYHVFFTDKKSENPFQPYVQFTDEYHVTKYTNQSIKRTKKNNDSKNLKSPKVIENVSRTEEKSHDSNIDEIDMQDDTNNEDSTQLEKGDPNTIYLVNMNSDFMETDGNQTEVDTTKKARKKNKRKKIMSRNRSKRRKIGNKSKIHQEDDAVTVSSDDSNAPLLDIQNQVKGKKLLAFLPLKKKGRMRKSKFLCTICDKNCYTYQNYHHHMSLHRKTKSKKCIKCSEEFDSQSELAKHIKSKHSSSRLTEYLKQLIERRKLKTQIPKDRKTILDGLRNSIKKVQVEKSDSTATLTQVDDRLSVKNFLENFTPDNEATSKEITLLDSLSIKVLDTVERPSVIKMTKFYIDSNEFKLKPKMPVKFKDDLNAEVYKVSIRLSQEQVTKPRLKFSHQVEYDDQNTDQDNIEDDDDVERDTVPEVAEEVMLNTEENQAAEQPRGTVIIENLSAIYSKVRIAHLQPEAPFYKIVSIDEALKKQEEEVKTSPNKIILPDGTKLVNVNPLAHLLGDQDVAELCKKKSYYIGKSNDIREAMAKTLHSKPISKKKKNVNNEEKQFKSF